MTKQKAQTDITEMMRRTQALFRPNAPVAPQIERFWQIQDDMLSEGETFARHWFERRHEAVDTALKALKEMKSEDRADPMAAMRAITDWQRGSLERINADLRECMAVCMHVAQAAATAAPDAAMQDDKAQKNTGRGNATKASRRAAASGAESDHATPV